MTLHEPMIDPLFRYARQDYWGHRATVGERRARAWGLTFWLIMGGWLLVEELRVLL